MASRVVQQSMDASGFMSDGAVPAKVLVVDDDEGIRRLCSIILPAAGFRVECASNGLEALDMLGVGGFDLVISDVNMPGLDGIGLYMNVIKDFPSLKERFFFISGYVPESLSQMLGRLGRGCLQKPFRVSELLSLVDQTLSAGRGRVAARYPRCRI